MSPRRLLLVIVAVIIAGLTVLVARPFLKGNQPAPVAAAPAPAPVKPQMQVLVAKGALPAGRFLRPDDLRWQPWPEDGLSANYVVEGQHRLEEFSGAVVRSGLADGEPITDVRVVRPGDRGFMAAVLEPGKRAITVPVTVSSGIAGFVFPGDYVDLILTFSVKPESGGSDANANTEHRASETLATNIRVVAVDQRADDQDKTVAVAKTATLEVSPKEAEVVAVALAVGQISLSLRSLGDDTAADAPKPYSHTWDSDATHLLPPPSAAGTTIKVSIVRAAKTDHIEFPRSAR